MTPEYKIVPVTATEEMVNHAAGMCDFCFTDGIHNSVEDYNKEIASVYGLAISKAPPSPYVMVRREDAEYFCELVRCRALSLPEPHKSKEREAQCRLTQALEQSE